MDVFVEWIILLRECRIFLTCHLLDEVLSVHMLGPQSPVLVWKSHSHMVNSPVDMALVPELAQCQFAFEEGGAAEASTSLLY